MANQTPLEFIESTAGQIAAELGRRGVAPDQRVMIAIEPDDWVSQARAFARPLVKAEGWTDADIDSIVEEERGTASPRLG
jgi:hypothetical protein